MIESFLIYALAAGIGVAAVAGPLGCFVIWRQMSYFGSTMSHSALLGVAAGLLIGVDPFLGVLIQGLVVVPALLALERRGTLSSDAILGILAHGTLALGLVLLAFMPWVRVDLMGYLFGDVLAVGDRDLAIVYIGGAIVLAVLWRIWPALLAGTVSGEIAAAEGMAPERAKVIYMLLIAAVVAIAMKVVGVLLIVSLLVMPAAAARAWSSSPEQMAAVAALVGVAAVTGGLALSRLSDAPAGPAIVTAALAIFLVSLLPMRMTLRAGEAQSP